MAGVELATAYYSLVPSMAGTAAAVRSQSAGLTGVWNGIGNDAGKGLKGGLVAGIGRMAAPVAAAFAAIGIGNLLADSVRTAFDSIAAASDLAEAGTAIEEIFGSATSTIVDFADTGATALGQSKLEVLNAAKTFGVYGAAAGLAGKDLSGFSTDLVGLSTDLASFFNTPVDQAIEAIGAGLRGESEPLRQYGVLLDDATLKARAMTLGIYDGTGSLTQQQRVLAAQAEIFAQTSTAQGDFARTSDGLANQQRILAANFENAKAKLGESLLPAMTTFTQFANDKLVPIINDLVEKVGPVLGDALTQAGPAFADLATAVAPLIPDMIKLATEALPPLVALATAISPILIDWTNNTSALYTVINGFFSFLSGDTTLEETAGEFLGLSGSLADMVNGAGVAFGRFNADLVQMGANVASGVSRAVGFLGELPGRVQGALAGAGSWLVDSGRALIQGFIDGILGMVGNVGSAVGSVLEWARGFFPNSPADRGPFGPEGWRQLGHSGEAIFDQLVGGFNSSVANLSPPSVNQFVPRATAVGIGGNGGEFTGNLYLDSGELLGMVRGEIKQSAQKQRTARTLGYAGEF